MLLDLRRIYDGCVELDGRCYEKPKGLRTGKFAVFLTRDDDETCHKFFVLAHPATRNQVGVIRRIHSLLSEARLAPEPLDIVKAEILLPSIRPEVKRPLVRPVTEGYGLALRRLDILPGRSREELTVAIRRLKVVCQFHRITRRGTLQNVVAEARRRGNAVRTPGGVVFVDIDPFWEIEG